MKYELVDFGEGRKLESIGDYLIDRPSPAADADHRGNVSLWAHADAVFESPTKQWRFHRPWPANAMVQCDGFRMPVGPTPFGHIGFFPEQFENWQWLRKTAPPSVSTDSSNQPSPDAASRAAALNLFAYTGASSIALAKAGFAVAHVDAAKPNVDSARSAARANDLDQHPIRYLVDDAAKFAAREVRRRRAYQTIVMDPPAYGHGPRGKVWRLERDLWPLLDECLILLRNASATPRTEERRLLFTGHSTVVQANEVIDYLRQHPTLGSTDLQIQSDRSRLPDRQGRYLDAGYYVRIEFSLSAR